MKNLRWLAAAGLMALAFAAPQVAQAEDAAVNLQVNGDYVFTDESKGQAYINESGRTMVPLRVVGDNLNYTTDWTSDGKIHISGKDGKVDVTLQVGSKEYTANGQAGQFATAPLVRDGRTYLPARDFSELYGSIYWDGESRTVLICSEVENGYYIIGNHLLRGNAEGIASVSMPEGYDVSSFGKPDQVANQRIIDGTGYVAINYNYNHSQQCPFFRDDGDHMTLLATINGSSSFWVEGNTIYHTMGIGAGPWTSSIDPKALLITTGENTQAIKLDFDVNTCTLSMENGQLIATEENGTRHVIDVD
ncbi:MAG: copper amine oxidase N-terminal domain-containing protein [Peptococcaceae bacterium]|nr:copper amine oxidase N-terminal domain-containing protein [Peptococcaceae bacterium]